MCFWSLLLLLLLLLQGHKLVLMVPPCEGRDQELLVKPRCTVHALMANELQQAVCALGGVVAHVSVRMAKPCLSAVGCMVA